MRAIIAADPPLSSHKYKLDTGSKEPYDWGMNRSWLIRGGRVLDPPTGRDGIADLLVEDGLISATASPGGRTIPEVDARGLLVVPGLIDMHVHFREPGATDAETIASGSAAAARGGFTTVVTMPNTKPATDSAAQVLRTIQAATAAGLVRVLPSACITAGRLGRVVADLAGAARAGAVAFTDDGSTVADEQVLAEAMAIAASLGLPVMDHALDPGLAGNGVMREGASSAGLDLPGIPASAEIRAVERNIRLAGQTNCRTHIQHISAGETVELLAQARGKGIPVSGEATPHHISLADTDVRAEDANFKMNPPLGTDQDRETLITGLCNGTIAALATDHAPHTQDAKDRGFRDAPFGVVGLETAVGVTYSTLVKSGRMDLRDWLARWTTGPATILGLPAPSLTPGRPADIALIDIESDWTVRSSDFLSRSRNTPFEGHSFTGRAVYTFCSGRMTWGNRP